jgi:UDP-4-amino-4-deoxy-L-arabinose-oxoglutarate aminotransferase
LKVGDDFLPFSRPSISEEDITAVGDVLRSAWITTGTKTAEFEERFRERLGCAGAVAVTSGTAGMHLVLRALDVGPGDEVITPSMTWASTVNLIVLNGARPVFVDVDRDTLMTSAEHVERALTPRTRLVVPVHFAGAALDLGPLRALARLHDVALVEDAAHAIGTSYEGEPIGRHGTAVFSFHPIKNITTGEGGMVCSDDAALLASVRRLRFHGLGVDAFDRETQGRAPQAEVLEPGFKYNLTDLAAALGIRQLARLDELNSRRAALSDRYRAALADVPEVRPLGLPAHHMTHAWHLFIVRLEDTAPIGRDALMAALKERGIGTGLHFRAVHLQKYYREHFPLPPGRLPNTEWNSERMCSLPLFPDMRFSDVDRVVDAIRDLVRR